MSDKFLPGASKDKIWRHISFQLDEFNDKVRFYLDSALVLESATWGSVVDMDASDGNLKIAGASGSKKASLAHVRMYVHDADGPLTSAQIMLIARQADTAGVATNIKCLFHEAEELEDKRWKDKMGHDCQVSIFTFESKVKPD